MHANVLAETVDRRPRQSQQLLRGTENRRGSHKRTEQRAAARNIF